MHFSQLESTFYPEDINPGGTRQQFFFLARRFHGIRYIVIDCAETRAARLRWDRCVFLRRGVRKKSHTVLKPLSYFARRLSRRDPLTPDRLDAYSPRSFRGYYE